MGSGEDTVPAKSPKPVASTQVKTDKNSVMDSSHVHPIAFCQNETPATPAYTDWQTSMQAFYTPGTPSGYCVPSSPSPHPHPYLYQHFLPYGAPLPYHPMYPHGGVYTHPMAVAQGAAPITTGTEGKVSNGKDQGSKKKSKGSSGNTGSAGGKLGENGKAASGSGNDGGASQSAESGSEGSSRMSDENTNQKEVNELNNIAEHSGVIESSSSARGQPATNAPVSVPGQPATNLNMGMDLWNASPAGAMPLKTRQNASGISPSVPPAATVGFEGGAPDHLWIQDERELKKQKRKQSNRESARRSRLRKQAECEELQAKVERLGNENHLLKEELKRLSEECFKLNKDNESIMEELKQVYGPEAVSRFEFDHAQPGNGEDNNHKQDSPRGSDLVSEEDGNFFKSNGDLNADPN